MVASSGPGRTGSRCGPSGGPCSGRAPPSAAARLESCASSEHVRADTAGLARVQQLADIVWPTLLAGCHTTRDTLAAITAAGFRITSVQRFRFPESRVPQPAAPHVLGSPSVPTAPGQGQLVLGRVGGLAAAGDAPSAQRRRSTRVPVARLR
jgi:hypothetical protein